MGSVTSAVDGPYGDGEKEKVCDGVRWPAGATPGIRCSAAGQHDGPAAKLPAYYRAIASLNFTVAEGWGIGRPLATIEANLAAAAGAGREACER